MLSATAANVASFLLLRWLGDAAGGSCDAAIGMRFRPLPTWGLWLGLLFPLTIGLAELPAHFGYAIPRLKRRLPLLMIGHTLIDIGTWAVYFTL